MYDSKESQVFPVNYQLICCPKRRRKILLDQLKTRLGELIRSTAGHVSSDTIRRYIETQKIRD
jgi:REP element-mobilizing transposase RayT